MGLLQRVFGRDDGKIETVDDQPQDEIQLVSFVRSRVEEARSHPARIAQEGIWMTNIAYLLGYDGVFYDTQSRQFKPTSNKSSGIKRNRIFVNKILPSAQNRLARLCKNAPKYEVRPNSPDAEAKEAARLKLQVLTMLWDRQKLNTKRAPLYMWMQQCGHSYIKVSYDAELGNQILDPTTGEMIYEGDLRADVVSAFEVFPDPLAKDFDELTWLAHAKVRKLDYFKSQYPERGHLVREEGAWLLSAQYEQRINSLNNVSGSQGAAQSQMKNAAIEIAYYEKRSRKHPNGRLIIIANGVLLHDEDLPAGEIPFAKFDDIVIGGKYCPESVITHARPLQDRKNTIISKKNAFIDKLLAGKYIAAKGAGLAKEALNDQSGEVLEYTPVPNAAPPSALTPPQLPQYVFQEEESIDSNFDDIFGINEVSKGQLPSAGIPAIGMQLLTEQDDTRIGVMVEGHEASWARVGRLELLYAQKFYKSKRLLKIAGKNQEYTLREFTGEDLAGDPDVIVIPGSTLPGSKVLKRQEIMNAWQQGLLGDPADPKVREKVLSMLEFGDAAEMWRDFALNERMAKLMIEMIERSIAPPVHELDPNAFIVQKLNEYRKERWGTLDPNVQIVIDQAIEERVELLMGQADPTLKAEQEGISPEPPAELMPPAPDAAGAPPPGEAPAPAEPELPPPPAPEAF